MCNYYHIYIRNHAHLASPLQELLKVGKGEGREGSRVRGNWQQVHQKNFDDLKKVVLNYQALNLYKPDAPFNLRCEASDWAAGCTSEQYHPNAQKHFPVAFRSKKLGPDIIPTDLASIFFAPQSCKRSFLTPAAFFLIIKLKSFNPNIPRALG